MSNKPLLNEYYIAFKMLTVLVVLLGVVLISQVSPSDVYAQHKEEDYYAMRDFVVRKNHTSLANICHQHIGIICIDNFQITCINGALQNIMNCADRQNVCVNNVGCVSTQYYHLLKSIRDLSTSLELLTEQCDGQENDTMCQDSLIFFCKNNVWLPLYNCSEIGMTCVTDTCVITKYPNPNSIPSNETSKNIKEILHITTSSHTNNVQKDICSEIGERKCEGTYIILCNGWIWNPIVDCSTEGLVCESGYCVTGYVSPSTIEDTSTTSISTTTINPPCTEGEMGCNGTWIEVCVGQNWKPVYDCSTQGLVCESGYCVTSSVSSTTIEDTSTTSISTTTNNPHCTEEEMGCNGTWIEVCVGQNWEPVYDCSTQGLTCKSGECVYTSTTTSTTSTVGGVCREAGRIPVPGTDCMYRLCFDDLTHVDITCAKGYHYDDSQKKCVQGQCNSTGSTITNVVPSTTTTTTVGGICTEAGRIPIPGTNCKFRQCFADLTYIDINCKTGYHYDDKEKKCVEGQCS